MVLLIHIPHLKKNTKMQRLSRKIQWSLFPLINTFPIFFDSDAYRVINALETYSLMSSTLPQILHSVHLSNSFLPPMNNTLKSFNSRFNYNYDSHVFEKEFWSIASQKHEFDSFEHRRLFPERCIFDKTFFLKRIQTPKIVVWRVDILIKWHSVHAIKNLLQIGPRATLRLRDGNFMLNWPFLRLSTFKCSTQPYQYACAQLPNKLPLLTGIPPTTTQQQKKTPSYQMPKISRVIAGWICHDFKYWLVTENHANIMPPKLFVMPTCRGLQTKHKFKVYLRDSCWLKTSHKHRLELLLMSSTP